MYLKYISLWVILIAIGGNLYSQKKIYRTDTIGISKVKIDEVTIKASKDNLSLKELPVSTSLISSDAIIENEINTLSDISAVVPNLIMHDYGSKLTSPIYLRGIGSKINAPSVALYVDGVPFYEKAAYAFEFFDIDRIEVLHGPQGTLYGRNTIGGVINIKTKSPMDYKGGQALLGIGGYGILKTQLSYYGKVNDKIAYSLALNRYTHDGFYSNKFTNSKVDNLESFGLRNRLIYKPSERLIFENIFSYERSTQGGYPYAIYNDSLQKAEDINYNQYSSYNRELFSDGFSITYNSNTLQIKSTTSFQYFEDDQNIDQDFSADSNYFVTQYTQQQMLSQEIIAQTKLWDKVTILAGAYGFYQQLEKTVHADIYVANYWYDKIYKNAILGGAIFGQLSYNPVENLAITIGGRFDSEKNQLDFIYDRERAGTLTRLGDTTYPTLSHGVFLQKYTVAYSINDMIIYANASNGYKAGGFNSSFETATQLKYKPEQSWNFELGAKSLKFMDLFYADYALFYIHWKDQQIYHPLARGQYLSNAGLSRSYGAEGSLRSILYQGFEAQATYGYNVAKFRKYLFNDTVDYSGNRIPFIPEYTIAVQLNQTFNFNGFKLRIGANGKNMSSFYWAADNEVMQDRYTLIDAKIALSWKNFNVDFWGKNLLNTNYNAYYFTIGSTKYVQTNRPQHFGANLTVNF